MPYLSRRLLAEGPVVVASLASDWLFASLLAGLADRSKEDATDGIRTTHEKDGITSLSGVIGDGDIWPLLIEINYVLEFF